MNTPVADRLEATPPSGSRQRWLERALLLLLLVGAVFTAADYGISWDESVQLRYGDLVLEYFASGFEEQGAKHYLDTFIYGPFFELSSAVVRRLSDRDPHVTHHFMIALCGILAVAGTMRLARRVSAVNLPLIAGLFLVTMPRFYGHSFINSKDIPFAAAFVWIIVSLLELLDDPRSLRRTLQLGLVLGALLAVRPGGLVVVVAVSLPVVVMRHLSRRDGALVLSRLTVALLSGWIGMVLFWPWAHDNPVLNPVSAIWQAGRFHAAYPVLFAGQTIMSDALPTIYLPVFLGITMPPVTLVFCLAGVWVSARTLAKREDSHGVLTKLTLLLWLFVPVLLVMVARPNIYDGLRHFLFLLPAVAVLAAIGACRVLSRILGGAGHWRVLAVGALAAILPLPQLISLHPYQMTYFNAFVGGTEGAQERFELDYWVTSYREAVLWINDRAPENGAILVAANGYSAPCAESYLREDIRMMTVFQPGLPGALPEGFDYYIGTTRYGLDENFSESPVVHRVARQGATFTVIRGRHPAPP